MQFSPFSTHTGSNRLAQSADNVLRVLCRIVCANIIQQVFLLSRWKHKFNEVIYEAALFTQI